MRHFDLEAVKIAGANFENELLEETSVESRGERRRFYGFWWRIAPRNGLSLVHPLAGQFSPIGMRAIAPPREISTIKRKDYAQL